MQFKKGKLHGLPWGVGKKHMGWLGIQRQNVISGADIEGVCS